MPVILIGDLKAPELMPYAGLTEREARTREGLVIAESGPVIALALKSGLEPLSFLMARRHVSGKAAALLAAYPDIPVYAAEESVLADLTGYPLTRGILCALRRPPERPWRALLKGERFALLDGLTDGANVGALFRSAAALGADAVFLGPGCCDPMTRKAVRVSMGSVFPLPWARVPEADWPDAFFGALEEARVTAVAMTLRPGSVPLKGLRVPGPVMAVLGAEGPGLEAAVENRCPLRAYIPMAREIDSLNVAAAGAVAFWELFR